MDAIKHFLAGLVWGQCPSCKANMSSVVNNKKLVMTVFQCPSCRIGLKLKKDSLIENLIFVGFLIFIGLLAFFGKIFNLFILFPFAILVGAYGLFKRKRWEPITKGEMCPQCHYDLYGLDDPASCPECGVQLIEPASRSGFSSARSDT